MVSTVSALPPFHPWHGRLRQSNSLCVVWVHHVLRWLVNVKTWPGLHGISSYLVHISWPRFHDQLVNVCALGSLWDVVVFIPVVFCLRPATSWCGCCCKPLCWNLFYRNNSNHDCTNFRFHTHVFSLRRMEHVHTDNFLSTEVSLVVSQTFSWMFTKSLPMIEFFRLWRTQNFPEQTEEELRHCWHWNPVGSTLKAMHYGTLWQRSTAKALDIRTPKTDKVWEVHVEKPWGIILLENCWQKCLSRLAL